MFQPHFSGALVGLAWGLIWVVFWTFMVVARGRERMRLYDLMEKILQAGHTAPPELTALLARRTGQRSDLRTGLVLVAAGLGVAGAGVVNYLTYNGPNPRLFHGFYAVFPILILIGAAFLLMAYLRRDERR